MGHNAFAIGGPKRLSNIELAPDGDRSAAKSARVSVRPQICNQTTIYKKWISERELSEKLWTLCTFKKKYLMLSGRPMEFP